MGHFFNAASFEAKLSQAISSVESILDTTRHPDIPTNVPHGYSDKFTLAEFSVRSGLAGALAVLSGVGLTPDSLGKFVKYSDKKAVTLRFSAEEHCIFVKEEVKEVEGLVKRITDYVSSTGKKSQASESISTRVVEYHWKYSIKYSLSLFAGTQVKDAIELTSREASVPVVTSSKKSPKPEHSVADPVDVRIEWMGKHLSKSGRPSFHINRDTPGCATPRRNRDIDAALDFFLALSSWANRVGLFFTNKVFPTWKDHKRDLHALNASGIFVPVVPVFEAKDDDSDESGSDADGDESSSNGSDAVSKVILSIKDVKAFLAEQQRSMNEKYESLAVAFPDDGSVISLSEANFVVLLEHLRDVCEATDGGVNYIEHMLRTQLVAAIGKVVRAKEFGDYMVFHNRKVFAPEFAPVPFSYAVRRLNHYPEGILSVESDGAPVYTSVMHRDDGPVMQFPINAATNVKFAGDHFLHCHIRHAFSTEAVPSLTLGARARQFSSFILMIGTITGADSFEAKHAIILENKDEVLIPLLLEQIPTPKEFRDAIESLSPEQQRFAKAFRAMQLESTLFAVAVVQIKPALERLLNLPEDSLTKEIRLTQNLMELFIKYQIPSDLLTYDGDADATKESKVSHVKEHVKALYDMIGESKKKELDERVQEAQYSLVDGLCDDGDDVVACRSAPPPQMRKVTKKVATRGRAMGGGGGGQFGATASFNKSAMAMASPPVSAMSMAPPMPSRATGPPPASPGGATAKRSTAPAPKKAPPAKKRSLLSSFQSGDGGAGAGDALALDYTEMPTRLDARMELLDTDAALRPTIVSTGATWTKKFNKALLAARETTSLGGEQLREGRNKAFDLLDALSRSGDMVLGDCQLHVVLVATHCFDRTVMDTVVMDNVNPIERVERSTLIACSTIHGVAPSEMIQPSHEQRVAAASPLLFLPESEVSAAKAAQAKADNTALKATAAPKEHGSSSAGAGGSKKKSSKWSKKK